MINSISSYCLKPLEKTHGKGMTAILVIGGIAFLALGCYGYFKAPHVWGNYVLFGIGGVQILGAAGIFLAINMCLKRKKSEKPDQSQFAQREIVKKNIDENEKQNGLMGLQQTEVLSNIFRNLFRPRDLINASEVCGYWHHMINADTITSQRLNLAFDHGYPLKKQLSSFIESIFFIDSINKDNLFAANTIPFILDIKENPAKFLSSTGYPRKGVGEDLLQLFERERASVLKAQDTSARWWFLIRVCVNSMSGSEHKVMIVFQRYTGEKNWVLFSECSPLPIIKWGYSFDWMRKLLENKPCTSEDIEELKTDITIESISLWHPENIAESV